MIIFKKLLLLTSIVLTMSLAAESDVVKVRLTTSLGNIDLELYQDKAPITVGNFLTYVDAKHYQNGSFVRTVRLDNDNGTPKITVIQGKARDEITLLPAIKL